MNPFINIPKAVCVVEVGPRDGLQNEAARIPTATKVAFIDALAEAGLHHIEATSFVSPRAIPQLADGEAVMAGIRHQDDVTFSALVPNERGMRRALDAGLRRVAVFTGATDTFTRHNIGMSIAESFAAFAPVLALARQANVGVRGYISVAFGCPYEGTVATRQVVETAQRLIDIGCDELSLGDTIGVATPNRVPDVAGPVIDVAGIDRVALHFHDTRGTALANVLAGLQIGLACFDASAGGLGGCPYAPGAAGNLATEDLVYMLDGMGIDTGIDLGKLVFAGRSMTTLLGKQVGSKVGQAWPKETQ